MAKERITTLSVLQYFHKKLKTAFAPLKHTHKISELTDYAVDSAFSSTSTNPIQNKAVKSALDGKVPTSRTINGKALSENITLTASDVGAESSGTTANKISDHNTNATAHSDIRDLVSDLENNKVSKVSGKGLSTNDYTTTEKNKLAGIAANAEVNQNAFSNVKVGTVTVSADSKTDTVELIAGTNVTITPDATKDSVTISAKDTVYSAAGSALGLIKSGGSLTITNGVAQVNDDSHNHIISNVDGLQAALDGKVPTGRTVNGKALSSNISLTAGDVGADSSGSANKALVEAKEYVDSKVDMIMGEGASETLDTIGEISDAILKNRDTLKTLNDAIGNKANKSDLTSHTGNTTSHITSAERTAWNNKVDKISGKGLSTNDYTTAEKNKLSGIAAGAQVNQKAFSNFVIGDKTVSADGQTASVTLVGSNTTITPDTSNNKITFGITKKNVTDALGYTPPTANTTYGVATSSTLGLVKSGTDITVDSSGNVSVNDNSHSHTIANVSGLQAALDGKSPTSHSHDLSVMINTLSTDSSVPQDNDYYVSQYVDGGTTTTTYHRRPMSALASYIKTKLATVASTGSYNDLANKPTIGNGTITIKQGGASKGTFTVNQTGNTTFELTDTNTWRGIQNNLTSDSTTDSLSAAQGKTLKTLVDGKLPLTGGTLNGNLTGQYITGTWLQSTSASNLSSKSDKIAVLDGSGWIYYRTLSQLMSDLGASSSSHNHSKVAINPAAIEMTPSSTSAGHGGYIDFHYNASTSDYTTRLIEGTSGTLTLNGKMVGTNYTDYSTARFRNIYAGTGAMTAGTTALANGTIYLQYEN